MVRAMSVLMKVAAFLVSCTAGVLMGFGLWMTATMAAAFVCRWIGVAP
jgi:hypothetical protein